MITLFLNNPINGSVSDSILIQKNIGVIKMMVIHGCYDVKIPKLIRIVKTKTMALEQAIKLNEDYTLICDDDILQLCDTNLSDMINYLLENKSFGAVSLYREDYTDNLQEYFPKIGNHICNACMMVRGEALKDITFGNDEKRPTCYETGLSLYNSGWKYGYIDMKKRIRHERRMITVNTYTT